MQRLIATTVIVTTAITGCSGSGGGSEASTDTPTAVTAQSQSGGAASTAGGVPSSGSDADSSLSASDPAAADPGEAESGPGTDPTGSAGSVPGASDVVTDDDLVRFIAAAEAAIGSTTHAGAVYEAPEIYIALAQVACARFSEGDSFAQISSDMLDDLDSGDRSDDERLVGAILGAASRTICPEHADKI